MLLHTPAPLQSHFSAAFVAALVASFTGAQALRCLALAYKQLPPALPSYQQLHFIAAPNARGTGAQALRCLA
jgi:hypothetical protein